MTWADRMKRWNKGMVAFDLVLGSGALLAPGPTLRILGHDEPSPEARALLRRNAPVWLTFAAAHATAAARGRSEDWWALAWLRATEWATDVLWIQSSPAFTRYGGRAGWWAWGAGAGNLAMSFGFAALARR